MRPAQEHDLHAAQRLTTTVARREEGHRGTRTANVSTIALATGRLTWWVGDQSKQKQISVWRAQMTAEPQKRRVMETRLLSLRRSEPWESEYSRLLGD